MRPLSLLILTLFASIGVSAQNETIETITQQEFEAIKISAKEPSAFLVLENTPNNSSRSEIGGKVVINTWQINRTLQDIEAKDKRYVIRLFVAHEIAHQSLYRMFGRIQPTLLNECQADIISGFLFFQTLSSEFMKQPNAYSPDDLMDLLAKVKDPLDAIFTLGDILSKDHTHPVKEHRRSAFRDGFAYGMLWFAYFIISNPEIPTEVKKDIRTKFGEVSEILNYTFGEDVINWSLKRSREIIHFGLNACSNIVTHVDYKWNTSSKDPHLYYSIFLKNIGSSKTYVSFESQIVLVLREDRENTLFWETYKKKLHQVILKPDAVYEITDKIQWNATESKMPRVLIIPEGNSLYDCDLEVPIPVPEIFLPKTSQAAAYQNEQRLQTGLGILYYDRNRIKEYINSIGFIYDKTMDIKRVLYDCKFEIPTASLSRVSYDLKDKKYAFEVTFGDFDAQAKALTKASALIELLKRELPELTIKEENTNIFEANWLLLENGNRTGRLVVMKISKTLFVIKLYFDQS